MPHHESPPMAHPALVTKSSGANGAPPDLEEVSSTLGQIFSAQTSQDSLDASYRLTDLLSTSVGFRGLHGYGILEDIKKAAADKKNASRREGSMFALGALFEKFPRPHPLSEVVFLLQED